MSGRFRRTGNRKLGRSSLTLVLLEFIFLSAIMCLINNISVRLQIVLGLDDRENLVRRALLSKYVCDFYFSKSILLKRCARL